jgi:FkbM family methyltransferase
MPKISLVVCLRGERDLLARLIEHTAECYDDLVVVHDGNEKDVSSWKLGTIPSALAIDWGCVPAESALPEFFARNQNTVEPGSIRKFVTSLGGRFFEHPRVGSLEAQSPFAWWAAKHDWILRLDADEFPSDQLAQWLRIFRAVPTNDITSAAFSCVWPLWNGRRKTTRNWPNNRLFLFDRRRVSLLGLVEQSPVIEGRTTQLPLTLHHQPRRKSYGIRNILFRRQAWLWRESIAHSLLQGPQNLPRWRHNSANWPSSWNAIFADPLLEGIYRALKFPMEQHRVLRSHGERFSLGACLNPALHHFMIGAQTWRQQGFPAPKLMLRRLVKKALVRAVVGHKPEVSGGLATLGSVCPWTLDLSKLQSLSKVISGGVGGDISFEQQLHESTGCEIALLDPSPTGRMTIEKLKPLPSGINFYSVALAGTRGTRHFAAPIDPEEGSFREPNAVAEGNFEWASVGLEDFIAELGWSGVDLLKLDIEGFEFEVITSMLGSRLRPAQLLVEFHYGNQAAHSFWQYLALLNQLRKAGYRLAHRSKEDHLFLCERQSEPRPQVAKKW